MSCRAAVSAESQLQEARAAAADACEEAERADATFVAQQAQLEALMRERSESEEAVNVASAAVEGTNAALVTAAHAKKAAEAALEVFISPSSFQISFCSFQGHVMLPVTSPMKYPQVGRVHAQSYQTC